MAQWNEAKSSGYQCYCTLGFKLTAHLQNCTYGFEVSFLLNLLLTFLFCINDRLKKDWGWVGDQKLMTQLWFPNSSLKKKNTYEAK